MKQLVVALLAGFITVSSLAETVSDAVAPQTKGEAVAPLPLAALAQQKHLWPSEVAITKPMEIPLLVDGRKIGSASLPAGTMVKLVEVRRTDIVVQHSSSQVAVLVDSTDLMKRVAALQFALEQQRQLRVQAQERTRQEAERKKALIEEQGKQVIDLPALVAKTRSAVMLIETKDRDGEVDSKGTGFVISETGILVTNNHVVKGAVNVVAKAPDGKEYRVLGVLQSNSDKDLAILKLEGGGFPFLSIADSDSVGAGIRVAVIGSPLGLEGSLSEGIVSAIRDLSDVIKEPIGKVIQITAPISPGSSGSPVLNANGHVIGVAAMCLQSGQAVNFAIPSNEILRMMKGVTARSVPRPFAGQGAENAAAQPRNRKVEDRVVELKFKYAFNIKRLGDNVYSANLMLGENEGAIYVEFPQEGIAWIRRTYELAQRREDRYWRNDEWQYQDAVKLPNSTVFGKPFTTTLVNNNGVEFHNQRAYILVGRTQKKGMGGTIEYLW